MTSEPDKAVGPLDIRSLLDLLNASEGSDTAYEDSAEIINEREVDAAQFVPDVKISRAGNAEDQNVSDRREPGIADIVETAGDNHEGELPQDDAENRFAAHIVHGMSKLKQR